VVAVNPLRCLPGWGQKKPPPVRHRRGRFEIRSEPSRWTTNGDDDGRCMAEVGDDRLDGGFHGLGSD